MRRLPFALLMLLPCALTAQSGNNDPVIAAMTALNVVLPQDTEVQLALSAAPVDRPRPSLTKSMPGSKASASGRRAAVAWPTCWR